MKKYYLCFLLIILMFNSYSQITFEKGYFVDNDDNKVFCLIKNVDWSDNPTEFEYKLLENSETNTLNIENVKEFGILNDSKYLRSSVMMDRSSDKVSNMNYSRSPIFNQETLFLKTLISGKANLYYYHEGALSRFFLVVMIQKYIN